MAKSYIRGHEIEFQNNQWIYSDTKVPTIINGVYNERSCGHCGLSQTTKGHDGCLGTLSGVMNACCGHGHKDEAYIQFMDGVSIYGADAANFLDILKKYRKELVKD